MDRQSRIKKISEQLSKRKVSPKAPVPVATISTEEKNNDLRLINGTMDSTKVSVPDVKLEKTKGRDEKEGYVCLIPDNHTIFESDSRYVSEINDFYNDNQYFGYEETDEDLAKRTYYKMYNVSHNIDYQEELFNKFNPLLAIINRSKIKFNRKQPVINFQHFLYDISYEKYISLCLRINKAVRTFLNSNGYDNIQDLLSDVLKYELTHGICYVYLKGNKLSFLNMSRLYSVVKTDGIYAMPLYYMPLVSFMDLNDVNYGISSLMNVYSFDKNSFKLKELKDLQNQGKINLDYRLEYLKVIKAKDVVVCRYNSSENKQTGYTVSPIVKVSHHIEHYNTLSDLRIKATPFWYTNFNIIKTNALDIKSIKDLNLSLQQLYSLKYEEGVKNLKESLQSTTISSNNLIISSLIDKVIEMPKTIEIRKTHSEEIDKITNLILKELGIDIDFINSTNKRNEDVQTSELEDYFSSYINSRQYLIEYIYNPFIKKELRNANISDDIIDNILSEYSVDFTEFPVTIEEAAKHVATVNNEAKYKSVDEIRNKLRQPLLGKRVDDFIPASDIDPTGELEQNNANSVNQHKTKRNANSTSKN